MDNKEYEEVLKDPVGWLKGNGAEKVVQIGGPCEATVSADSDGFTLGPLTPLQESPIDSQGEGYSLSYFCKDCNKEYDTPANAVMKCETCNSSNIDVRMAGEPDSLTDKELDEKVNEEFMVGRDKDFLAFINDLFGRYDSTITQVDGGKLTNGIILTCNDSNKDFQTTVVRAAVECSGRLDWVDGREIERGNETYFIGSMYVLPYNKRVKFFISNWDKILSKEKEISTKYKLVASGQTTAKKIYKELKEELE